MVRFPDEAAAAAAAAYRRSESETPETKRILEQINRVNINLGYIKPKPQPQLRFPNGAGYSGSFGSGFGNGGGHGHGHNNHGGGGGGGSNHAAHTHYYSQDSFQTHYQGNNNNYVPSIRRSSSDSEPTPRRIEPSHMVLVPDLVDLQTFVYPAHLLKSISLLDALKVFEPELMKSQANESRLKIATSNEKNADRTKNILKTASDSHLSDDRTDKINIILVTLKPKEDKKSSRPRLSRANKSNKSRKVKRQSKLKSKTIFTRPRPRPVIPPASNVASVLSQAPVTQPAVRQDAQPTVNKGPFAALFDRPNEVVEAIKEGGIIIQRLRVRNGGIAIAGPNGIATAGSGGTAIVGPGGTAITHPKGLSIAGPGARVISVPETTDLRTLALSTNPGEVPENGTVVAHGPVIHYNHPVPVERLK